MQFSFVSWCVFSPDQRIKISSPYRNAMRLMNERTENILKSSTFITSQFEIAIVNKYAGQTLYFHLVYKM